MEKQRGTKLKDNILALVTVYDDDIVCPWCGEKMPNAWEYDDGEYNCVECEKPFILIRNISVTYSTYKW